jgi:FkbM family methyltransferase
MLRLPLAAVPKRAVLPILAGPNRGFNWCVGAADHGCWLGSYELEKQRAIWRARREGAIVLDVGANVGFYTLLLARTVGVTGHVIAIEPDRTNVAWLRWHLRANNIQNAQILIGAVASLTGTAMFSPGPTHTTGRVVSSGAGKPVRAYQLDEIVFRDKLPIPTIVKMDIEGGESAALSGASRLLAEELTTWFVALHSREQADACIASFRRYGYRLCFLSGAELPVGYEGELSEIVAFPRKTSRLSVVS